VAKKKSKPVSTKSSDANAHSAPVIVARAPKKTIGLARFALPFVLLSAVGLAYVAARKPPEAKDSLRVANSQRQQCKGTPDFIGLIGFQAPMLSTAERDLLGLSVIEKNPQTGQRTRVWQHQSWRQAGNLSAFTTDARGNIYVIPAPRVNVADNPANKQNRIYKIANESGDMLPFFEFPVAKAVHQKNPFAGMGITYDCASDSLFLSSVAGSSPETELGKLMRISLGETPRVESVINNFDGFGVASVDSPNGPALIAGHARSGDVFWFALDEHANFLPKSNSTVLLSLHDLGPEGWDRARKIELGSNSQIIVRGIPFQYNLSQPSAQERPTVYEFQFDLAANQYRFMRWGK
jgi:hypothetical protein